MKLQWKSVSEEQERRNSRLRDYKSLIGEEEPRVFLNSTQTSCALTSLTFDLSHNNKIIFIFVFIREAPEC